jgi:hypothetical protein
MVSFAASAPDHRLEPSLEPSDAPDSRTRPLLTQSASAATAPSAPATATAAPADLAAVDTALEMLTGKKAAWAALSLDERITMLKEIKARLTDKVGAVLWPSAGAAAGPRSSATVAVLSLRDAPPLPCPTCLQLLPWARATAGIRCTSQEASISQDMIVTGEGEGGAAATAAAAAPADERRAGQGRARQGCGLRAQGQPGGGCSAPALHRPAPHSQPSGT